MCNGMWHRFGTVHEDGNAPIARQYAPSCLLLLGQKTQMLTLLVFQRGEDDSSLVGLALGLKTSKDLIINSSANTAPVAAEPDRIST